MAIDQSQIQRLLEATSGVQTNVQTAQPNNPNNGNPNTVNNASWMIPVQSNAAGQWWAPAPLQMPSSGPSVANQILANLQNMRNANRNPPTTMPPEAPVTTPTPTTPTTPPPGSYTPPQGPDGPGNRPIGPISGPIAQNPHNWFDNYQNAQPNTNLTESGLGRTAALDWLRMGFQGGNTNRAWNGVIGRDLPAPDTEAGRGFWGGIWENLRNMAGNAISEGLGNLSDWRQVLDILSEPFIPGDWYNSQTGEWNNPLEASGITDLIGRARESISPEQQQALLDRSLATAQTNMNSQRDRIISDLMNRFNGTLSPEESRRRAEEIYNSAPEMSQQEWRRVQESFDWNNFWNSRGQGTTRNPVTGLPSQDLIDDMINQMQQRAMDYTNQMIARRGNRYR